MAATSVSWSGSCPGLLAAGAYLTWRLDCDLGEIDLLTYFRLLPAAAGVSGKAALIGAGVALAFDLAGVTLLYRPALSTHGTARWAEPGALRRAKLLARGAEEVRGPI